MFKRGQYVVAALVLMCGVYVYFTPYLVVRGMNAAMASQDISKFSGHVNYPALKESLKLMLRARLVEELKKKEGANPAATQTPELPSEWINPMAEAMATPESVAMMMKGNKLQRVIGSSQEQPSFADPDSSMAYESWDTFVLAVTKKGDTGAPVELVYTRDGWFSWQLTAVRMPG